MAVYEEMRHGGASAKDVWVANMTDDSPFTRADLLAHQHISQRFAVLTPDTPSVNEKDELSQSYCQPTGNFWLVDPRGWNELLAQDGEFTVNVGLAIGSGYPFTDYRLEVKLASVA